jgi:hypothetical protein
MLINTNMDTVRKFNVGDNVVNYGKVKVKLSLC